MKNIIKCLMLSVFILFISGCDAEYNMIIKKDLRIEEQIVFTEKIKTIRSYSNNADIFVVKNIYNMKELNQYNIDDYYLETDKSDTILTETATKVYSNFTKFEENNILKGKFFETMVMDDSTGSLVEITFVSIKQIYQVFVDSEEEDAAINSLKITITVPYQVVTNNANSVDKITNSYTWEYNKATSFKDIELTFNKTKEFKISIIDKIKEAYKKANKPALLIIIGITVAVVLIIIIAIRNAQNNKL